MPIVSRRYRIASNMAVGLRFACACGYNAMQLGSHHLFGHIFEEETIVRDRIFALREEVKH